MRRSAPRAEVAVAFGSPARIDRDNILQASLWALARAVAALPVRPQLVFVDGRDRIDVGCDCQAVISGDALVALDRRGLDRRQGDARPADAPDRRRASRLRLRAPHGLQRAGAFRRAAAARAQHPPPALVLAGRRLARRQARASGTKSRARRVASLSVARLSVSARSFGPAADNASRIPFHRIAAHAAAPGLLDRGADAGRALDAGADVLLFGAARRCRRRAGDRPRIHLRQRSRAAAGVLARGDRVPARPAVRRLCAGADLRRRRLLGGVRARRPISSASGMPRSRPC